MSKRMNTEIAPRRGRPPKYNWADVDWSKPDDAIARELGCSLCSVKVNRFNQSGREPVIEPEKEIVTINIGNDFKKWWNSLPDGPE